MLEDMEKKFTKYEIARILGARALQLSMDAPLLLKLSKEELDDINYDVLRIAELEFVNEILPITVKRPFPEKKVEKIKKMTREEAERKAEVDKKNRADDIKRDEEEKVRKETEEEKEIKEQGEIMELATPEDEVEVQEKPEGQEEL